MSEVNTGLDPWLGFMGSSYAHELVRQASRVASELVEQPTQGIPRTVSIIRSTVSASADTALGIPATWAVVAGLEGLQATYFQPSAWDKDRPAQAVDITKAERSLLIADTPSAGGISSDTILLTDKIRVDDPEFGMVDLEVTAVKPLRGTGLIHVESVYRRS